MEGIFHLQSTAFQAGDVSFQVFLCRGAKLFLHILFSLPPVPFPWSAALGGNAKSFYRGGTLQIENEQIVRKEDQTSAPPNRVQISVAHSGQADDCKIHRLQIVGCRAPTTDTSNKFPISHRRRLRFLSSNICLHPRRRRGWISKHNRREKDKIIWRWMGWWIREK